MTDERNQLACRITHFTSFAILVSPRSSASLSAPSLVYASYIGCSLSIVCLTLTIILLLVFKKNLNKGPLLYIHLNLSIALLVMLVIFLLTVQLARPIKYLCVFTTSLLHYFLLSAFSWMLVEGIMLYLMVVRVFGTAAEKWYWFLFLGWGLPVPIVIISSGVLEGRYKTYIHGDYCWLRVESNAQAAAIWTFIVPMVIIIMINTVILVMTVYTIIKSAKSRATIENGTNIQVAKTALKGTVILLPLMGITWVFGLFAVNQNTLVFAWIFTILNSLQGVFIFIFHVGRNDYVLKKVKEIALSFNSTKTKTTVLTADLTKESSLGETKA